ncbi:MAG: class I SAM-dependent methyltransferase [Candidatus Micrarchaeota archaeon]|nr:class I SAM-dependent methyltransferase [Candidatus Micrarchaeota archaeon]
MKILDLGCGKNKGYLYPEGWEGEVIGVDIDPHSQADVVWDLEKFPYPFEDNEFDRIFARHSIEHLEDTVSTLKEIHRITRPGGIVHIETPYACSPNGLGTITHKKFFSIYSFEFPKDIYPDKDLRFRVLSRRLEYIFRGEPRRQSWKGRSLRLINIPMDFIINLSHRFYEKILRHYVGDADCMTIELQVMK